MNSDAKQVVEIWNAEITGRGKEVNGMDEEKAQKAALMHDGKVRTLEGFIWMLLDRAEYSD